MANTNNGKLKKLDDLKKETVAPARNDSGLTEGAKTIYAILGYRQIMKDNGVAVWNGQELYHGRRTTSSQYDSNR